MKKTKRYQKGKHLYIKSGAFTEVHLLPNSKEPEYVLDENYEEYYIDQFNFEIKNEGFKIGFGKQIFGTNITKLKRSVFLEKRLSKKFVTMLSSIK